MKRTLSILSIILLGLLSCQKVEDTASMYPSGTYTREFVATLDEGTRTGLQDGYKISWSAGDTIRYYTRDNGLVRMFIVPEDCRSVRIPVELDGNDRYIAAVHGGSGMDGEHSGTEMPLRDAISCEQDGSFGNSHISTAFTEDLDSGRLLFHNRNAVIGFKVERKDIGHMILLSSGTNLATFRDEGSRAMMNPGGNDMSLEGISSDRILISGREDGTYLVSLSPTTLKGFTIDLYDKAGQCIGKVESEKELRLERNDLVDLGVLDKRIKTNGSADKKRLERNVLFERACAMSVPSAYIENEYIYESTDYSQDGKVTQLQKAARGNGIDIVIVGDGYTDRLIEDGTYLKDAGYMMDCFFDIEPYTTFRELFNVYAVTAVSKDETLIPELDSESAMSFISTLGDSVEDPHIFNFDYQKAVQYALMAIDEERINETTIISPVHYYSRRGSAVVLSSSESTDYASGTAIGIVTMGIKYYGRNTIIHECAGHAFAKLWDEYIELEREAMEDYHDTMPIRHSLGLDVNVDVETDPRRIYWSRFLYDYRYKKEVGIYEGAWFRYGMYRPSEHSVMNCDADYFNAPSRELIYYRIHKLAFGDEWKYDFEDFAEYDKINREQIQQLTKSDHTPIVLRHEEHNPPVFLNATWRDVIDEK